MSLFPLVLWAYVLWAFVLWAFVLWAFVMESMVSDSLQPAACRNELEMVDPLETGLLTERGRLFNEHPKYNSPFRQ